MFGENVRKSEGSRRVQELKHMIITIIGMLLALEGRLSLILFCLTGLRDVDVEWLVRGLDLSSTAPFRGQWPHVDEQRGKKEKQDLFMSAGFTI